MDSSKKEQLDDLIQRIINTNGIAPIYNCTLSLNDTKKGFYYNNAIGTIDESNTPIKPNYLFRIGSITKTFTAVIILQLMEEGILNLEDTFLDKLTTSTQQFLNELIVIDGINYSKELTIKNLLEHRSGLLDYFADDEQFFEHLTNFPTQNWDWKMVMDRYFKYNLHKKAVFKPATHFYYSDTNYLLLAVLIEELTNEPFYKALQKRIIAPLSLKNTFLEYHQKTPDNTVIVYPFQSTQSLKNTNTSFDWGAGGLISNTADLDIFMRALLNGHLFKKESTLQQLLLFKNTNNTDTLKKRKNWYGLGLYKKEINGLNFIGHTSAYGAMLFYEPNNQLSISLSLNQSAALPKANWLMNKVVETYLL